MEATLTDCRPGVRDRARALAEWQREADPAESDRWSDVSPILVDRVAVAMSAAMPL